MLHVVVRFSQHSVRLALLKLRMPEETKIVYHIGDEQTPYLKTISGSPGSITLGDFKAAINKTNYKFFFRSIDQEYG